MVCEEMDWKRPRVGPVLLPGQNSRIGRPRPSNRGTVFLMALGSSPSRTTFTFTTKLSQFVGNKMNSPKQLDSLRRNLSRDILNHVTEALRDSSSAERLTRPVLRFEVFIEDANDGGEGDRNNGDVATPASRRPLVSVSQATSDRYYELAPGSETFNRDCLICRESSRPPYRGKTGRRCQESARALGSPLHHQRFRSAHRRHRLFVHPIHPLLPPSHLARATVRGK